MHAREMQDQQEKDRLVIDLMYVGDAVLTTAGRCVAACQGSTPVGRLQCSGRRSPVADVDRLIRLEGGYRSRNLQQIDLQYKMDSPLGRVRGSERPLSCYAVPVA